MGRRELALAATLALLLAASGAALGPTVEYLHVTGTIEDSYAVTQVEERLTNPLDTKLDATFVFQVPEEAFVSNLTLLIDGVLHVARVVPKEEARERYTAAVSAGRDAGLMEQAGKGLFTYSVSFSPGQTIVVGLRYEQYLVRTLDAFEYPLVINPAGDQSIGELSVDLAISSYKDLASVEVPSHPELAVEYLGTDRARVRLEKRGVTSPEELLVRFKVAATSKAGILVEHQGEGGRYFFHVFAPVVDEYGGPLDKDIVFVLDKSGSMGQGRKLEQMKEAFAAVVGQLREGDSFDVVEFDTAIAALWPELRQATAANREEAASRIRAIAAGGSTNIAGALERALGMLSGTSEERVPIVVFLTDGRPTAGITNTALILKDLKEKNTGSVSIFCLGLGSDLDFPFLRALSLQNWGHAVRIYEGQDVSEQIGDFYRTISTPLLRDLRFTYGEGAVDVYPTAAGRLFAGSEVVVAGRYVGEGGSLAVQVSGRSRRGTVQFSDTLRFVGSRENAFIPRFWAFMRIQDLLDRIAAWGENDVIVGDIVNTSIRFNFVTPYTSLFLEVEEPVETVEGGDTERPPEPSAMPAPLATGMPAPYPTSAPAAPPSQPPDANIMYDVRTKAVAPDRALGEAKAGGAWAPRAPGAGAADSGGAGGSGAPGGAAAPQAMGSGAGSSSMFGGRSEGEARAGSLMMDKADASGAGVPLGGAPAAEGASPLLPAALAVAVLALVGLALWRRPGAAPRAAGPAERAPTPKAESDRKEAKAEWRAGPTKGEPAAPERADAGAGKAATAGEKAAK